MSMLMLLAHFLSRMQQQPPPPPPPSPPPLFEDEVAYCNYFEDLMIADNAKFDEMKENNTSLYQLSSPKRLLNLQHSELYSYFISSAERLQLQVNDLIVLPGGNRLGLVVPGGNKSSNLIVLLGRDEDPNTFTGGTYKIFKRKNVFTFLREWKALQLYRTIMTKERQTNGCTLYNGNFKIPPEQTLQSHFGSSRDQLSLGELIKRLEVLAPFNSQVLSPLQKKLQEIHTLHHDKGIASVVQCLKEELESKDKHKLYVGNKVSDADLMNAIKTIDECFEANSLKEHLRTYKGYICSGNRNAFRFEETLKKQLQLWQYKGMIAEWCDVLLGRPTLTFYLSNRLRSIISHELFERLSRAFNTSQLFSLYLALTNKLGIALIQGPPGTGKTTTILGLISALFDEKYASNKGGTISELKQILVCAASNAAIDELLIRIKLHGIFHGNDLKHSSYLDTSKLERRSVNLVRIGDIGSDPSDYIKGMQLESQIEFYLHQHSDYQCLKNNFSDDFQRKDIMMDAIYQEVQQELLTNAEIIGCTLSSACLLLEKFNNLSLKFHAVIIDEACQATEPSLMQAFQLHHTKIFLVGDPKQLGPFTQSVESRLKTSMFERLQQVGHRATMLTVQYRMHPSICHFPSQAFYNSMLQTSPEIIEEINDRETNSIFIKENVTSRLLIDESIYPLMFYNHSGEEKQHIRSKSWHNPNECEMVIQFVEKLVGKLKTELSIGIISLYKDQVNLLQTKLSENANIHANMMHRNKKSNQITVQTVDGFQGQEKDIIILSTVRVNQALSKTSFLEDESRLNVAMTRAKKALIIFGNKDNLSNKYKIWKDFFTATESLCRINQFEEDDGGNNKVADVEINYSSSSSSSIFQSVKSRIKDDRNYLLNDQSVVGNLYTNPTNAPNAKPFV